MVGLAKKAATTIATSPFRTQWNYLICKPTKTCLMLVQVGTIFVSVIKAIAPALM